MKKRIYSLDFIRAIAVVLILLTHYNAKYIYMWDENALKKVVLCWKLSNIYIGDFGVALFLIVSGAALMKASETNFSLLRFYKKRFLSIYPMFWIAYFCTFMYSFWKVKGINQMIPKWSIIWSIMGMDGYLNGLVPNFYQVGEWFLGFIVIFYMIFPILKKGVEKSPLFTGLIISVLYICVNYKYTLPLNKSIFIVTRLPELFFGMYYAKYIKKSNRYAAGMALLVLLANALIQPTIDKDIQTTYVGIAAFVLLAYCGEKAEKCKWTVAISDILSKYSYAIFLTHHYIITQITSEFDLTNITILESHLLFVLCCLVIAFFSKILYDINEYILEICKCLKYNNIR